MIFIFAFELAGVDQSDSTKPGWPGSLRIIRKSPASYERGIFVGLKFW
jgi:hypothetical protein